MKSDIYAIADVPCGRLAIMPRPRAGDWLSGEVNDWKQSGLDWVVSLLEDSEIADLGLEQESARCEKAGIKLLHFPIPDRGIPASVEQLAALVTALVRHLQRGGGVGIHCRIGVGRSALVAACVLTALGMPVESAWNAIQKARGLPVPDTPEQRAWVTRFAAAGNSHPSDFVQFDALYPVAARACEGRSA